MLDLLVVLLFTQTYSFDHTHNNLIWCEEMPDWFVKVLVMKDKYEISYFEYKQAEGYLYSQEVIVMWAEQYSYTKHNC